MTSKLIVLACLLAVAQARFLNNDIDYPNLRIFGGRDAHPGEFPHQVSLQWGLPPLLKNRHFCGGTIINDLWILTASHCMDGFEEAPKFGNLTIHAGLTDFSNTETEQSSYHEKYFKHPKWIDDIEGLQYDIALIKLMTPLNFTKYVNAIDLPEEDSEPLGEVILSGWGATGNKTGELELPEILQTQTFSIIDRKVCNQAIKDIYKEDGLILENDVISETVICTGHKTGISACSGDSGGPLIREKADGEKEIVGITSFTMQPCARKGAPSGYVKVSSYIDWIIDIIAEN